MNFMKLTSTALILACGIILATNVPLCALQKNSIEDLQFINFSCITAQEMEKFKRGELPYMVMEFNEGTLVPMQFFLHGDWISFANDAQQHSMQVQVNRTFYIRLCESELSFSLNLTDWKPLLEFITGTASLMIGMDGEKGVITLGAEANLR